MLHELLELLLHAKSGAIAAVFLIGTTGALVTATVENGVTTITITPNASASPSASASASATASPTGSASATASPSASASPTASSTSSPTGSPSSSANCSQQAHDMAAALQEVNRAYAQDHSGLERLRERARTDALRTDLANADKLLKQLRDSANQKIHSLFTCAKSEDQDKEDEDKDNDEEHATSSANPSASPVTTSSPTPSPTPTSTATATTAPSSSPLVTGNDFKTVADNAVAAMKLVFDTVSAEFPTATASAHPKPSFGTERRGDSHEGGDRD